MRRKIALFVASGAGSGYIPVVPGTWGALLGVAIHLVLAPLHRPALHGALVLFVCAIGIWAAGVAERSLEVKDPSVVVIDEVAGMLLSLYLVPLSWLGLGVGFVLFRVLDVVKPFPCRRAERLPSGWGIMTDDFLAGLYTNLLLRLAVLGWGALGS